jgi:antitoxin VapB
VSLNIKNEETHRLIKRLAELTGQTQTSAVEDAVRRRLEELTREEEVQRRYKELGEIADRASAAASPEWLTTDWDQVLYDENGLPH